MSSVFRNDILNTGSDNMDKKIAKGHGDIKFKLADRMKEKGMSKNRLCNESGFRFETVQGYYLGNISRVDLFVLSEFCRVLGCNVQDIIEYVPKKK